MGEPPAHGRSSARPSSRAPSLLDDPSHGPGPRPLSCRPAMHALTIRDCIQQRGQRAHHRSRYKNSKAKRNGGQDEGKEEGPRNPNDGGFPVALSCAAPPLLGPRPCAAAQPPLRLHPIQETAQADHAYFDGVCTRRMARLPGRCTAAACGPRSTLRARGAGLEGRTVCLGSFAATADRARRSAAPRHSRPPSSSTDRAGGGGGALPSPVRSTSAPLRPPSGHSSPCNPDARTVRPTAHLPFAPWLGLGLRRTGLFSSL